MLSEGITDSFVESPTSTHEVRKWRVLQSLGDDANEEVSNDNPSYVAGEYLRKGYTFSLKHNQSATIVGLKEGTNYELTDVSENSGYEIEPIGGPGGVTITSENGYHASGTLASKETGEIIDNGESPSVITGVYHGSGTETIGFARRKQAIVPTGFVGSVFFVGIALVFGLVSALICKLKNREK